MNETDTRPTYAVHAPDGTWLYYLGTIHPRATVTADEAPMTRLPHTAGWWTVGHEADQIVISEPRPPTTVGYRLSTPDAASARYPARLTVEQWETRTSGDDADGLLWDLYEPYTEPTPDKATTLTGPWLVLDGEEPPPAEDPRRWTAKLPYALTNRPEYAHLLPGDLHGFREHIKALLKAMPRVKHVFDAKDRRGLDVTVSVPFDKPVTRHVPARNLDGRISKTRKGRTETVMAERRLFLPIPDTIGGNSRADAADKWDEEVAHWLSVVGAATVTACSTCQGTGHVDQGATMYNRPSST